MKNAIAQLAGGSTGVSQQGAVDTFVDSMQEIQEGNPGSEAAQEQTGGTANGEPDAAIGQVLRGERPGNSIDSVQPGQYNNRKEKNGGNGYGLQQNDGGRSSGNPAAGLAGVQQSNGTDNQGRGQSGGLAGDSGVVRVSDQLQEEQRKHGTQTYPVLDTTVDSMQEIQEGNPGSEAAQEQTVGTANAELDAAIGQVLRGGTPVDSVDTEGNQAYNGNYKKQGGINHAGEAVQSESQLQGTDGTRLPGRDENGRVRGERSGSMQVSGKVPGSVGEGTQMVSGGLQEESRGGNSSDELRDPGILRISGELRDAQRSRGTPTYEVQDTTRSPEVYEKALSAGRNSDAKNGWCVTPKSVQELRDGNVCTFMNESGTVGVGIAPDGDIVAVFKNRNGGPKKALDTIMPIAIEQGGDRLDCYGEGLAQLYARYGFEPVARVEFNPEYASEGWTPDKGTPYIYVMKHNGDSADTVVKKMGTYPKYTTEQLNALPTYGKGDYDSAMAYRDSLMKQGAKKGNRSEQTYLYLTGQGGTENGGLGSDLRTGRGQSSENAGQNAGTQEGSAAGSGEGLLAGYDWYNNDVARGERPRLVQSSEQSPGIKGTGAAERNFSGKADYQELLYEGNVQRDRPGDVRPMEVPKKDSYGRNVSEFVGNAYGADVTPDSMASEIEMLVQEGALGFDKKTNAWAYALQNAYERGDITKKQMQILKKDMVFRYSGVVDTPKFDSMVEAGVGGDDAKKVVDLLAGLKPESGYKDVRDIQNAEAIAGSGLSDGDTVEALYAYLPNAQDENLREMLGMGFSAEDYVRAWRMYDGASGKGKKQRTIDQYQKAFGVDYSTAKMIYEVYG